ncbi:unnamed protein product [Linum trigynum]|uniref:Uncharacterized protein n=1 Tax=Linum trigynum TaxID=586398 RepID=A0AAV2D7V0_9ROSI
MMVGDRGRREGCNDGGGGRRRLRWLRGGGGRRRPRWLQGEGRDSAGRWRARRREGCSSDERRRAWRVGRTAATTVVEADRESGKRWEEEERWRERERKERM